MSALDDAWQAALAAEHQAVFGYGLLGPRLTGPTERGLARDCQAAHEALRDATASALRAAGQTPVDPAADYAGLYPVPAAPAARRLAIRLEADAATAWRFLYARAAELGDAGSRTRASAQQALMQSAVRATRWRRTAGDATPTVAFPGI
ncbi:MAG: hypothetical protein QOG80_2662 [Pseudonocardiales bacterium]|nr:hypothetical protein [Pseudonocardiales bacterium]